MKKILCTLALVLLSLTTVAQKVVYSISIVSYDPCYTGELLLMDDWVVKFVPEDSNYSASSFKAANFSTSEKELYIEGIYADFLTIRSNGYISYRWFDGEYEDEIDMVENEPTVNTCQQVIADAKNGKGALFSPRDIAWVDLGLSVKWAKCNLGASKPEEYGDYYAWGETNTYYTGKHPFTWSSSKRNGYNASSYKWMDHEQVTKYNFSDNKTELERADDAAHVKLGHGWRIPTYREWYELSKKCTFKWVREGKVEGLKIIGPNGNSIFLPAAGQINKTELQRAGVIGRYWSSSLFVGETKDARCAFFAAQTKGVEPGLPGNRVCGYTIRPVKD